MDGRCAMAWLNMRLHALWNRLDLVGDDPGFEADWETAARAAGLLASYSPTEGGTPRAV